MARHIRIASWLAAGVLALMVGALVNRPEPAGLRAEVPASPPAIVTSPRLGHYDPGTGYYVWWR